MKCIYCAVNTNHRSRQENGGKCESCKRRFAFEPRGPYKLTDQKFRNAIASVSDDGTLKFSTEHLWYELARREANLNWVRAGIGVVILLFLAAVFLGNLVESDWPLLAWLITIPVVFLLLRWEARNRLRRPPSRSLEEFGQIQAQWVRAHGPIENLLTYDSVTETKEAAIGPEKPYYSFARLVVTDTHATAALLIANKFHIEQESAVVCIDGYPFSNWHDVVDLLRANEDVQIALVHDATPSGCSLPALIRQPGWFPEERFFCVDVGLRPTQVRSMALPVQRGWSARSWPGLDEVLEPEEVTWLGERNYAELSALAPKQLISAITRNFARLSSARGDELATEAGSTTSPSGVWFFDDNGGSWDSEESFG